MRRKSPIAFFANLIGSSREDDLSEKILTETGSATNSNTRISQTSGIVEHKHLLLIIEEEQVSEGNIKNNQK